MGNTHVAKINKITPSKAGRGGQTQAVTLCLFSFFQTLADT